MHTLVYPNSTIRARAHPGPSRGEQPVWCLHGIACGAGCRYAWPFGRRWAWSPSLPSRSMVTRALPDEVAAFIHDHIRTLDDLYLFVAVADDPERWWDEASVARELLIEVSEARRLLEHLAAQNLMD